MIITLKAEKIRQYSFSNHLNIPLLNSSLFADFLQFDLWPSEEADQTCPVMYKNEPYSTKREGTLALQ